MLLAEVTKFSLKSSESRYAECAIAAGWANSTDPKSKACEKLVKNLNQLKVKLKVPLVVRLAGTNFEEGKKILQNSNLKIISADNLDDAAKKIVEAIK